MHTAAADRSGEHQALDVAPSRPPDPPAVLPDSNRSAQVAEYRGNGRRPAGVLVTRAQGRVNLVDTGKLWLKLGNQRECHSGCRADAGSDEQPAPLRLGIEPADPCDEIPRIGQVEVMCSQI